MRGGDIHDIPLLISPGATYRLVLFDAAVLLYADQAAEIMRATQAALAVPDRSAVGSAEPCVPVPDRTIGIRVVRNVDLADGRERWRGLH